MWTVINYDGRKPEPPYQTIDDLQAEAFAKGAASRQAKIDAHAGEAKGRRESYAIVAGLERTQGDYVEWVRWEDIEAALDVWARSAAEETK